MTKERHFFKSKHVSNFSRAYVCTFLLVSELAECNFNDTWAFATYVTHVFCATKQRTPLIEF